ncbi:hypothetical protein NHX12_002149 [Muraenolepis orangiensis]|uniref:Acyl-coenzyme A thioesterase THEM4 n=1 Tax=Muraenolepis orangiensis TaxID=630683 RepID=A0A9Q0IH79_9TELE|nr:hypothetical protein NHX12_002149 [Muraenolepis orangiensis]
MLRYCVGSVLAHISKRFGIHPRLKKNTIRPMVTLPSCAQPRDHSLPNPSWSKEMMENYDHFNSQCEVEGAKEGSGLWTRLPSYSRSFKFVPGGGLLSKIIQSEARLFTRNIKDQGAGFEYVLFINKTKDQCVGIFQAGPQLEGPPGKVHGGATATMIDTVTGTHSSYICGPCMTANLNINYRSPISLGSTVMVESTLDQREGRKTFLSCRVTSWDGSKIHVESKALFLSISARQIFGM